VWRELAWSSGEIILARQKFNGLITAAAINTVFANNMATLMTDITSASISDDRLGNRTVYSGSVFVADVPNDFNVLLNDLKVPNVRDLYYRGHSNGDAIGYSEGSPNNGIKARTLRLALRNFDTPSSTKWDGRRLLTMRKPFRFVFIDGCLSVKGDLVGAFGIVEDNDHTRLGKKRRAFLGWTTTTQNSIMNTTQANWSGEFWKQWVDVNNDDYDVWLQNAITQATAVRPIPMNPAIKGYRRLTWAE
jgi:hypothetical protein